MQIYKKKDNVLLQLVYFVHGKKNALTNYARANKRLFNESKAYLI